MTSRRLGEQLDDKKAIGQIAEPPKSCKVVTGEVSRDGWCKAFALAD
jgi:hypothetical protein